MVRMPLSLRFEIRPWLIGREPDSLAAFVDSRLSPDTGGVFKTVSVPSPGGRFVQQRRCQTVLKGGTPRHSANSARDF